MTESDWDRCTDPQAMLTFLEDSGHATDRKLRLFAVACCRRVGHHLTDYRSRRAVEVAEQFVEGAVDEQELASTRVFASDAAARLGAIAAATMNPERGIFDPEAGAAARANAAETVRESLSMPMDTEAALRVAQASLWTVLSKPAGVDEAECQCHDLRCIFGNPFRPVTLDPAWLAWNAGTVRRLVEAAYQERLLPQGTLDPGRLAVLADALEESGCADAELLGHLRGPGPHMLGCWCVDLLLGKS